MYLTLVQDSTYRLPVALSYTSNNKQYINALDRLDFEELQKVIY
jgi:hypothetical protein